MNYTIIISSAVVAAMVSAIIAAFVSFRIKYLDFRNDYHKVILEKRIEAYQFLETQIAVLKMTVMDEHDGKGYPQMTSLGLDEFHSFQQNLFRAMANSLWIESQTVNIMEEINQIFLIIGNRADEGENLVELGKSFYNDLSALRVKLENQMKLDLTDLHRISRFLKRMTTSRKRLVYAR